MRLLIQVASWEGVVVRGERCAAYRTVLWTRGGDGDGDGAGDEEKRQEKGRSRGGNNKLGSGGQIVNSYCGTIRAFKFAFGIPFPFLRLDRATAFRFG